MQVGNVQYINICVNLLQDVEEIKYEEIVDFVKKTGNYRKNNNNKRNICRRCKPFIFDDGCFTRKQTHQNIFKWLRKGRQITSLRAYMQHLEVLKNGSALPIETLQLFFSTVKICRIFMGK